VGQDLLIHEVSRSHTRTHHSGKDLLIHEVSRSHTRTHQSGKDLLIHEVYRSHTRTHHSGKDSSGRVISSSQRPLTDKKNTTLTTDRETYMPPVGFFLLYIDTAITYSYKVV
jgi:hypothetical protein